MNRAAVAEPGIKDARQFVSCGLIDLEFYPECESEFEQQNPTRFLTEKTSRLRGFKSLPLHLIRSTHNIHANENHIS